MEKWLYVMTIKKGKTYNKVTKAVITRHVENLRKLDADGKAFQQAALVLIHSLFAMSIIFRKNSYTKLDADGKLELCGPLKGCPGVAGMVIFKTQSYEEAYNKEASN